VQLSFTADRDQLYTAADSDDVNSRFRPDVNNFLGSTALARGVSCARDYMNYSDADDRRTKNCLCRLDRWISFHMEETKSLSRT